MGKFRHYGIKFPHFGHTVGMGKRMDSLVAVALGAFAAYLFFLAATGRPLLALALAGLCMLALRRVLKTAARWMERLRKRGARARKRCAKRRVEGLAGGQRGRGALGYCAPASAAYPGEIAAVNGQLTRRIRARWCPWCCCNGARRCWATMFCRLARARGAESAVLVSTAPAGQRRAHAQP